ncbi:MAG: ABC transporter ATP-binding protein [Gammaproteobacteria bacterium]|nr:MAG: ABC transporter ATP-binding protein [Gammaproteobacteria bacterium]
MIEADRLTRRYGDFLAVSNVSFSIEQGEIVGLLGHNGAGKTTIMKMLTGYLEPSSGVIRVDGLDLAENPQAVQQALGYLPENLPLYPEMSVADYLDYAAQLRGIDTAGAVRRAIAATELEEKALDPIATLSRGFKQRVGVAQAILHEPKFLILDEPTNGLDPGQTEHMRSLIQRLAESATVILSTHIMQEVDAICDRAIILRGGSLVLDERLADLKESNELSLRSHESDKLGVDLEALDCVVRARSLGEGGWMVTVTGELDAAGDAIARMLVAQGHPLFELAPQRRNLESVFREVNAATGPEVQNAA